jgi:O-glycosyl hydrolase
MNRNVLLQAMVLMGLAGMWASPVYGEGKATVDFGSVLQAWDGFGVNYVETCQTRDYAADPQEYGGFSTLSEKERQEIVELIFGEEGLKPGVVKMFLDPFHEGMTKDGNDNDDPNVIDPSRFDHETTTKWMRYFVKEGLKKTRARGADFEIVTTMYGPPPWTTQQKIIRGRDLDPAEKYEMAEYMIAWVLYLRETESLPVTYVSLHNEGEDFVRWPMDGQGGGWKGHDYNLYWPQEQVAEFISILRQMLDKQGLQDVGVTPGETTNWDRFVEWGYAHAIAKNPDAIRDLGLITSHGFTGGSGRWYGTHNKLGVELIRLQRPEIHAWTTSMTWGKMDIQFVEDLRGQIYGVGVNACIPWACIQTLNWVGGDPNPGCAFLIDKGDYQVRPGYYYYKQFSRAGQRGMRVAKVESDDKNVTLAAFSSNGTENPDSFLVINPSGEEKTVEVSIQGTKSATFEAYRTSPDDQYKSLGIFTPQSGRIMYTFPAKSVTTFFGQ